MLVLSRSVSCIKILVEDLCVELLNLTFPDPGSPSEVVVLKSYLNDAPPKFPSTPDEPEVPDEPDEPDEPDDPEEPEVKLQQLNTQEKIKYPF